MSTAVIDIGTNTLLLLIVDDTRCRVVDLCRFGRLGQGLDASGRLADAAIERSLDICREYRRVLDDHGIRVPCVVATQALREARNATVFTAPAEQILGAPIEIIGGEREAELAFISVAKTFPELGRMIVVDVGGGSTEVIAGEGGRVVSAVSLPIGAVRLFERHLAHDPPTAAECDALDRDIAAHVGRLDVPRGLPIVGTAGTATTLAAIELGLTTYDSDAVTGVHLSRERVAAIGTQLLAMTVAQRRATPGIEPERADVIAAGVAIYSVIVAALGASDFITCDRGVRWGVVLEKMP